MEEKGRRKERGNFNAARYIYSFRHRGRTSIECKVRMTSLIIKEVDISKISIVDTVFSPGLVKSEASV